MIDHAPQALDSLHDGRMPAWERATACVRRMQRLQLALLLLVGAAIILIVAVGAAISVDASREQRAIEVRGAQILELRGDFATALFDAQKATAEGESTLDTERILRFIGHATEAYTIANSYEPTNLEERRARDRLISLYDSFLAFGGNTTDTNSFRALSGTEEGTDLARTAASALDDWIESNAATISAARVDQDRLVSRIAIVVIALVLLMAAVFVFTWRRIEKGRAAAISEAYAQTRRFNSLVRNASDMVMVIDNAGRFTYCSQSVIRLLGWSHDDLFGTSVADLLHPDDTGKLAIITSEDGPRMLGADSLDWRLKRTDGSWLEAETLATDLRDDPAVGGIVLNSRDVTDRKAVEAKLAHQAFHDPLTGLANRALFEDRLNHALELRAEKGTPVAVLVLDLDDFKVVNDSLGHQVGDELLNVVGQRLSRSIRPGDTAARLGGDEYAVLLETVSGPAAARDVAKRIFEAVRAPIDIDDRNMVINASIGIALAPSDGEDSDTLVRNADTAMYDAKNRHGEPIASFAPEMKQALDERLRLTLDLNKALDEPEQLQVEYQPIVRLDSGELVGLEALLRWDHPELGRIMPDRFIPLAEETGLIVPIGYHVLQAACAAGATWNQQLGGDKEPDDERKPVIQATRRPRLIGRHSDHTKKTGLSPKNLLLEVTESVLMRDVTQAIALLEEIKAAGIRVAIDDFGTGYSSLSQLGRLPVDMVKIDKSFVDDLSGGTADSELAGIIVQLGAVLELETVAEGVEAGDQVDDLQSLRCSLGQGFYFAKPMPASEIPALIALEQKGRVLGTPTG